MSTDDIGSEASFNKEVVASESTTPSPAATTKPFSDGLATALQSMTALTIGALIVANRFAPRSNGGWNVLDTVTTAFLLSTTLSNFVRGARFPKSFTKIVHPLVTCATLTWLMTSTMGTITGRSFMSMLAAYKVGAGAILLNFLGPSVASLACQMYDRRKLMKENLAEVTTAILVSSFGGLFGTAAAVRWLGIGSPALRLSLLTRNITSPLAMAIAGILNSNVSLAVSMVVVTGLLGANFGATLLDAVGIRDPVARGLGIGAAAHGLGTAAFANEKDAFPFAAIAMALTASACTVIVSVPPLKRALVSLALGYAP